MKQTAPLTEVYAMPKAKWNLNTIYISERLQESLRPISRCALTTVVAPMGYGKTTAVEWYLAERARAEKISVIRISVYSANLAIFWRSVQDAFARAGFDLLRDYDCPSDAAGGGLLIEDLCHALAGERPCYIFLDDFHLLTSRRAAWFLCALAARLPANVHLILASRDVFLSAAAIVRLGAKVYQIGVEQLRLNHTELAVYISRCGTELSDEQIESLLYYSEGWFSAVYLNLRMYSEHGVLADRSSDISSIFTAAMIDPLPEKQREFLAVMGLADEFTVEMAQDIMQTGDAAELLAALTGQNAFVRRLPDGVTYRFHHMMKECALRVFLTLPQERRNDCRRRFGAWYEQHRQYLHAMQAYYQCGDYHALLRVVQQDAGILLSSLDPKNVLDFLDECPEDTLKAHPAALLVLMRSMFNWRNIPRMLALRQLLLTAIDEDKQRSAEERGNLLGECDLIMSFLCYNDISAMSRLHRSASAQMSRPAVSIQSSGELDVRLALGAHDVLPRAGRAGERACRDGRVHAALLQDHGQPRTGRGDHHARGGGVHAGTLHRRAHRARTRLCADRGQRTGEHGALLRLSGAAAQPVHGHRSAREARKAARTAARASQCLVAQPLERGRSLSSCPARQHGQHPRGLPPPPAVHRPHARAGKADDRDDREPGLSRAGRIRPRDRPQRGSADAVRGDALCAGRAAHPHPDRGGLRNARQARRGARAARAGRSRTQSRTALRFRSRRTSAIWSRC